MSSNFCTQEHLLELRGHNIQIQWWLQEYWDEILLFPATCLFLFAAKDGKRALEAKEKLFSLVELFYLAELPKFSRDIVIWRSTVH